MKIISANLNGIRSAHKKGFFDWLKTIDPDVVCVQELKAQEPDLSPDMCNTDTLRGHFYAAQKKGYSGTGLYSRATPLEVITGFGTAEFDNEGRYLETLLDDTVVGRVRVVSLYAPSGSADDQRQASKFRFMEVFLPHLKALIAKGDEVVICGDWNIAHQKEDLKNWRGNQKNSGFLPEEREWLSAVLALGLVDVFRVLNPIDEPKNLDQYTWWSNRGQAWQNNVGWRIDYQFATKGLAARAHKTEIYKNQRFSDHAPLIIDYA